MTRVTSSAGDARRGERGFALYELILALAILGLVAGVVYPRVARGPGPTEMRATAEEIAALFRTDRNAALRERRAVVSRVDVEDAVVRSGYNANAVRIPGGVEIKFVQSSRQARGDDGGIRFDPSGRSSGGALTLTRGGFSWRVSVNWLTAGVLVSRPDDDDG
jgi:general secretion pathway protein H